MPGPPYLLKADDNPDCVEPSVCDAMTVAAPDPTA